MKKVKPAAFSKGTAVAGPGRGEHSAWALRLDGKMVQATGNVRNVSLLEYVKKDLSFDFVIIWEAWSDVWGFPGFGAAGDPYKASLRKLLKVDGSALVGVMDGYGGEESFKGRRMGDFYDEDYGEYYPQAPAAGAPLPSS